MLDLLFVGLFGLLIYFVIKYYYQSFNSPPGPRGLPLVGVLPQLIIKSIVSGKNVSMRDFVNEVGEQHRKAGVISFCLGTQRFIYFHTFDAIKEALVDRGTEFNSRPNSQFKQMFGKEPVGVASTNGLIWKVHRRFAMMVLRNLGIGKTILEEKIIEESKMLIEKIRQAPEGKINTVNYFVRSVSNIISQLLFGSRWNNDEEFDFLYDNVRQISQSNSIVTMLLMFYPEIAPTGILQAIFPSANVFVKADKAIIDFMNLKYEEISIHYDVSSEPCCYVEAFIKESEEAEENVLKKDTFLREQCLGSMSDLTAAGTDTTTNGLAWSIIYLSKYPHVMKKLQSEIDATIQAKFDQGSKENSIKEVELVYADRYSMPYLLAVMDEVQRCASLLFHGGERGVDEHTKFRNFDITPHDLLFYNMYNVHHDPQLWGNDVKLFRPERFLDESERVYQPSKYLMPFGLGKRNCIGETLARTEYFHFLYRLCREFDVKPSPSNKLSLDELIDGGSEGLVHAPDEHEFIFIKRC